MHASRTAAEDGRAGGTSIALLAGMRPGLVAVLAAAGSLVACYGTLFAATALDVTMTGWRAHLQAVVMWALGGIALFAIWQERRLHQRNLPLLVGAAGVLLMLYVLYVQFEQSLEILAYVCLVVAALLNQNHLMGAYAQEVRSQAAEIETLNARLAQKVERQGLEIERLDRLRSFLSPKVAELVVTEGESRLLDSHRRYIACLFCDIRHFTTLSEHAEPEDTIAYLQQYHERVGQLAEARNGTIGFRAGDGLMVFFNDPIPCQTPVLDAVRLGLEIQDVVQELRRHWQRLGFSAGVGVGVAAGYATLGMIGAAGGAGYTAIGNPVNIAARLCDQAEDGEVLLDQRACVDLDEAVATEPAGTRRLKGVGKPVETWRVIAPGTDAAVDAAAT